MTPAPTCAGSPDLYSCLPGWMTSLSIDDVPPSPADVRMTVAASSFQRKRQCVSNLFKLCSYRVLLVALLRGNLLVVLVREIERPCLYGSYQTFWVIKPKKLNYSK